MNLPRPILPLGYSEAAMFLRTANAPPVTALISIHSRHEPALDLALSHRLDLSFDDADAPDAADPNAIVSAIQRDRWHKEIGWPRQTPPTPDDARAILDFATRIRDLPGLVLCHCSGGISRAPAAALLCLAAWTAPAQEPAIVRHLLTLRLGAAPHPDLIRFADALLRRKGALIEALAADRRTP